MVFWQILYLEIDSWNFF